jgi:hypothetical protein
MTEPTTQPTPQPAAAPLSDTLRQAAMDRLQDAIDEILGLSWNSERRAAKMLRDAAKMLDMSAAEILKSRRGY